MQKAPTGAFPAVASTVKLAVNPNRAAVFLDGRFVGHVAEFEGLGRGLLVAPGAHKIQVSLPGYQTFETQINPLPNQKVEVKTDLLKDRGIQPDSSGRKDQPAPAQPPAHTVPQRQGTDTPIPPPDRAVPPPPPNR